VRLAGRAPDPIEVAEDLGGVGVVLAVEDEAISRIWGDEGVAA
jgi:hypothetical protein